MHFPVSRLLSVLLLFACKSCVPEQGYVDIAFVPPESRSRTRNLRKAARLRDLNSKIRVVEIETRCDEARGCIINVSVVSKEEIRPALSSNAGKTSFSVQR